MGVVSREIHQDDLWCNNDEAGARLTFGALNMHDDECEAIC